MPKGVYKRTASMKKRQQNGKMNSSWKGGISLDKKKYMKEWVINNRERKRFHLLKRVHLLRNAIGGYSYEDWVSMKERYRNTCPSCLRKEPDIKLTVDHIVPISKGGTNCIENLQPLCKSCNAKKYTKIIKYNI